MKKNLIRLGSVAALAAGLAFANAQSPAGQTPAQTPTPAKPGTVHRTFRQRSRQRMMQALNLTPAQREQAKSIFQQAHQSAQPFTQQLRQNREGMALAVKANDNAKIQQLATQRGHLEGQVMAIRSQAAAKFYTTLTPQQRAKADQIHQRFERRMEQRTGQRTNG
jgi:Spy/CpxP family protein refolding chaperone